MLLSEVKWNRPSDATYVFAWPTEAVLITRRNDGRYYIKKYEGPTHAAVRWDGLDEFTAQAVLIHLTQGGNHE